MPHQQTSLFAYEHAKLNLGAKQGIVLEVIRNFPQCDNQFIADKLRWPINRVTPRVHELRRLGKIQHAGTYPNALTGRSTMRWEII